MGNVNSSIFSLIREYRGEEPWEPTNVAEDYKDFKDYTYNIKMSLKDINYLISLLEDYGNETNGAYCAKARFYHLLLKSGVHLEVREKKEKYDYGEFTTKRMFARPPFGCVKNMNKDECELNNNLGCFTCKFNCIEELELSGETVPLRTSRESKRIATFLPPQKKSDPLAN